MTKKKKKKSAMRLTSFPLKCSPKLWMRIKCGVYSNFVNAIWILLPPKWVINIIFISYYIGSTTSFFVTFHQFALFSWWCKVTKLKGVPLGFFKLILITFIYVFLLFHPTLFYYFEPQKPPSHYVYDVSSCFGFWRFWQWNIYFKKWKTIKKLYI